jgi:hypothetical protein
MLAEAVGDSGRGTFFADGPVVAVLILPDTPPPAAGVRGQAFMNLEWFDCRQRQGSLLRLDLPDDGGRLSLPPAGPGYSPVCDAPGHGADSGLQRGPLSPSGFPWPPHPELLPVLVTIQAPASVRRGTTLGYTVTLRNDGAEQYVLDPCPDYVEVVGAKQAASSYQLNCAPVGAIPPGEERTFAMRMDVPATLALGPTTLSWGALDGRLASPWAMTSIALV